MDLQPASQFPYPELLEKTKLALSNSYCPYSKFSVAATVLTEDNQVFTGVNVENSSFSLTMCAERSAICSAISNGCQKFKAIIIASSSDQDECIKPCGACRQVLAEFGTDWEVYLTNKDGCFIKRTVSELLPFAFTPCDLR